MRISDWSSDVCSSDLRQIGGVVGQFDLDQDMLMVFAETDALDLADHDVLVADFSAAGLQTFGAVEADRDRGSGREPGAKHQHDAGERDRKSTRLNSSH